MQEFLIQGGRPFSGSVEVHGAKNSVLPILAASLLSGGMCRIHNCPRLRDVETSAEILTRLGCAVRREDDALLVDATTLTRSDIPDALMRKMRSSVIFLGAILARCGQAEMSFPGGCELGSRPIDLHLAALGALGADIRESGGCLHCAATHLAGTEIHLSFPSVGATENIMLAACAAEGVTVIENAAREPEIVDLQDFLVAIGADVRGAGGSTVAIRGGKPLHGCDYRVRADRIVAATYLAAAAAAGGEVEICGTDYRRISTVTSILAEAGCNIRSTGDCVLLRRTGRLAAVRPVRTAPYPGFPTDAQAPIMAALCTARGTTVFVENIFESRYRHVAELRRMGADIRVEGKVAVVSGVERLSGASVRADDLRGGAALLIAAFGAEGESHVTGLSHIDRGYDAPEAAFSRLGADIVRRDVP
ncbi:MAG TPA: UDP-N-acetylglucosamine 1-carboxyvinyltransferase [Oscillospiraceae bacterium]|nr:UDP-N-acetylglucosamine 1-carboxyvinyltransferase [Oscillospiraceae bacterium]